MHKNHLGSLVSIYKGATKAGSLKPYQNKIPTNVPEDQGELPPYSIENGCPNPLVFGVVWLVEKILLIRGLPLITKWYGIIGRLLYANDKHNQSLLLI